MNKPNDTGRNRAVRNWPRQPRFPAFILRGSSQLKLAPDRSKAEQDAVHSGQAQAHRKQTVKECPDGHFLHEGDRHQEDQSKHQGRQVGHQELGDEQMTGAQWGKLSGSSNSCLPTRKPCLPGGKAASSLRTSDMPTLLYASRKRKESMNQFGACPCPAGGFPPVLKIIRV